MIELVMPGDDDDDVGVLFTWDLIGVLLLWWDNNSINTVMHHCVLLSCQFGQL